MGLGGRRGCAHPMDRAIGMHLRGISSREGFKQRMYVATRAVVFPAFFRGRRIAVIISRLRHFAIFFIVKTK